jgi:hypothetical protein
MTTVIEIKTKLDDGRTARRSIELSRADWDDGSARYAIPAFLSSWREKERTTAADAPATMSIGWRDGGATTVRAQIATTVAMLRNSNADEAVWRLAIALLEEHAQ